MYVLGEVDPAFLEEAWSLYGIGLTVLLVRFAIRLRTVGLRGFRGDDAFAFLLIVTFTLDAVTVHHVYYMSTNVEGAQIQKTRDLTEGEIRQLVAGSKQQFVAWYSYAALVWCLKGTMIFFFKRMTLGLSYQRLVNYIGLCCIVAYIAVILTITFSCWPVHLNYQVVPPPGRNCTLKPQNFIVMTVLNVLTDAAILYVPMPLLWTLRVPLRQKLIIGLLLSSGIFVISAAILRVVSTLAANPSALTINRWGVRETIVGIIAVNLPIYPPLFRRSFWRRGKIPTTHGQDSGLFPHPHHHQHHPHPHLHFGACPRLWPRRKEPHPGGFEPFPIPTSTIFTGTEFVTTNTTMTAVTTQPARSLHGSQENIITREEEAPRQVLVERTFEVTTETVSETQMQDMSPPWCRTLAEMSLSKEDLGMPPTSQI